MIIYFQFFLLIFLDADRQVEDGAVTGSLNPLGERPGIFVGNVGPVRRRGPATAVRWRVVSRRVGWRCAR